MVCMSSLWTRLAHELLFNQRDVAGSMWTQRDQGLLRSVVAFLNQVLTTLFLGRIHVCYHHDTKMTKARQLGQIEKSLATTSARARRAN
jgi:hypothetical protein